MKRLKSRSLILASLFIIVTLEPGNIFAQSLTDDGGGHTVNANGSTQNNRSAQNFTIRSNSTCNSISFTLRGGDGGFAKAGADCQSNIIDKALNTRLNIDTHVNVTGNLGMDSGEVEVVSGSSLTCHSFMIPVTARLINSGVVTVVN